jgi:hypothetical protein
VKARKIKQEELARTSTTQSGCESASAGHSRRWRRASIDTKKFDSMGSGKYERGN